MQIHDNDFTSALHMEKNPSQALDFPVSICYDYIGIRTWIYNGNMIACKVCPITELGLSEHCYFSSMLLFGLCLHDL